MVFGIPTSEWNSQVKNCVIGVQVQTSRLFSDIGGIGWAT